MNINRLATCLFQYMPRGSVWEIEKNPELFTLFRLIAEELIRLSLAFQKTELSVDPRYAADELIENWAVLLNEPSRSGPTTENRNFLHDKFTNIRGQSEQDLLFFPRQTSPDVRLVRVQIAKAGHLKAGESLYQDEYNFVYIFDRLKLYDYGNGPEVDRKAVEIIEKTKQAHCVALYYHDYEKRK